ncbi:response regulator transcription factor [Pseudonocardia spinosispora]|uniref:response regulator transcription factor n=1 Tax=Pseudonocardia spinosispora TaxID=103441 RepID=UPI00146FC3FE|nr:response regulator transcription factor [Pseudonocardia spinosispora]
MRVLIIDDNRTITNWLQPVLLRKGISTVVRKCGRGVSADLIGIDAILLELELPDTDGISLCRLIRESFTVPIIATSKSRKISERVLALNAGADDYLSKPYFTEELVARLEALHRRYRVTTEASPPMLTSVAGVSLDLTRRTLGSGADEIQLTPKECDILKLLLSARGSICERTRILARVWGRNWPAGDRTLDVHMATLRAKLPPNTIHTIKGVGYHIGSKDAGIGSENSRVAQ